MESVKKGGVVYLHKMLSTMKVPGFRRNLKKQENIIWLIDNLKKENQKHPYYEIVIDELREKLKKL